MMEKTQFEIIFESFRRKFPPAESLSEATLKLSTTEITEMIEEFWPELVTSPGSITGFMIDQGYKYEPIEQNERVRYVWLIGNK